MKTVESSPRVENVAGDGEIAHYEQFLVFPQCFQKMFGKGLMHYASFSNSMGQSYTIIQYENNC